MFVPAKKPPSLALGKLIWDNFQKLWAWYTRKAPRERLIKELAKAKSFEEWQNTAIKLDEVLGNDLWYVLGYREY